MLPINIPSIAGLVFAPAISRDIACAKYFDHCGSGLSDTRDYYASRSEPGHGFARLKRVHRYGSVSQASCSDGVLFVHVLVCSSVQQTAPCIQLYVVQTAGAAHASRKLLDDGCASPFGQCGGEKCMGGRGSNTCTDAAYSCCPSSYICQRQNALYWQCMPQPPATGNR